MDGTARTVRVCTGFAGDRLAAAVDEDENALVAEGEGVGGLVEHAPELGGVVDVHRGGCEADPLCRLGEVGPLQVWQGGRLLDQRHRQYGEFVQGPHDGAEQSLGDELRLLPVAADEVVQVERGGGPGEDGAVGGAGGRVGVASRGVGGDLVQEDGDGRVGGRVGRGFAGGYVDREGDLGAEGVGDVAGAVPR